MPQSTADARGAAGLRAMAVVHRDRGVAKHAVLGLVKVAALEGAAAGLTANAVAPGWMRTPLADNQIRDHIRLRGIGRDDVIASMVAEQPARRFVDPAEVAALITFLAGDGGSAINGACIPVDTGTLAS